jgi:hypothetical protein
VRTKGGPPADLDGHCGEALKGSQPCSFNQRRFEQFKGIFKVTYNSTVRPLGNFAIGFVNFGEMIESNKVPYLPEAELSSPDQRRGAQEIGLAVQFMPMPDLEIASVWDLGWKSRGLAIEELLGGNLPPGFPVVDRYVDGVVTSIKSIDLRAASYQDSTVLARTIDDYVDKVSGFNGARRSGAEIRPTDIQARELELAVPPGSMSVDQQKVINASAARAKDMNVTVKVTPVN